MGTHHMEHNTSTTPNANVYIGTYNTSSPSTGRNCIAATIGNGINSTIQADMYADLDNYIHDTFPD